MASRSSEEVAVLERFAHQYGQGPSRARLEIERAVCGCDYGSTGWATREEAERVGKLLQLGAGMRLLDLGLALCRIEHRPPRLVSATRAYCSRNAGQAGRCLQYSSSDDSASTSEPLGGPPAPAKEPCREEGAPTDVGDRATVPPDKTIEAHYNMATTLQATQRLTESLEATMRGLGLR